MDEQNSPSFFAFDGKRIRVVGSQLVTRIDTDFAAIHSISGIGQEELYRGAPAWRQLHRLAFERLAIQQQGYIRCRPASVPDPAMTACIRTFFGW